MLENYKSMNSVRFWLAASLLLITSAALAQGDGPRAQTMLPTGPWVLVPTYIDISSNQNFQQSILINGADIDADVSGLTVMRAFSINGRYAQVWVAPLYGTVSGEVFANPPAPAVVASEKSGFSDPVISFKYGLIGMPAVPLAEFGKQPQANFQLGAFVSVTPPIGEYDDDNLLNLGAGRWSLKLGLPMVWPLGTPQKTFLEVHPGITFYEDNDDPTGGATKREQDSMFRVESHLSHNFNAKIWGSVDLAYQKGGETQTDGVSDDNETDHWGGGFTIGYVLHPAVSVQASYGEIFGGNDDAIGEMFRLKVAILIP